MNIKTIKLSEWDRILFGNAPAAFLLEVLFRSLLTYIVLLVIIKLLGKRMSGQLSITEMAIMLTLGAIISVPMQMPDRGVLHGIILLLFVLIYQRVSSRIIFHNRKIELFSHGRVTMLVKDGILQTDQMGKENISREQLFAVLRGENIFQLGKVKRMYLEPNGHFSIYPEETPKAGFSILPESDPGIAENIQQEAPNHLQACKFCGNTTTARQNTTCTVCGKNSWETAVL